MKTYANFVAENVDQGLYSYRKLNNQSAEYLGEWMRENSIPNPIHYNLLHCTVVCSDSSIPGYGPDPAPIMLSPASYRIGMLNEALVVFFKSDVLEEQWQRAMNMGAQSRYPRLTPHISLSYKIPEAFDHSEIKPPHTFLVLDREESRPMIDGWASLNNLKEYTIGDMTLGGGPAIYVPQNHLNIPREEMPQIPEANKMAFVDWLEGQGIFVQFIDIPVSILKSTQEDIDLKKVENLTTNLPEKALNKPLIISKENYIVDGHHRWLALLNRDPHYMVSVYRVNLPIKELLHIARNYQQSSQGLTTRPEV